MSLAYYPCFKNVVDGANLVMDGKALAKASDQLTSIAEQLTITPLEAFLGGIPDVDVDLDLEELWFEPAQGLTTVTALLAYLQQNPKAVSCQADVLSDLQYLKDMLDIAQVHKTRWHLAIDV